jgi:hypothetical protein
LRGSLSRIVRGANVRANDGCVIIVVPDTCALARLVRVVAAAPERLRNKLTYWAACRAGEMVADGLLDAGSAIFLIAEAAISAGMTPSEAQRAARSGVRKTGGAGVLRRDAANEHP